MFIFAPLTSSRREGSLKDLQGKRVLVTGGAVGIGRAIEERSARQGAHLILTDTNVKALDEAATALRTRGFSVETFFIDVAEQEGVAQVWQGILAQGGPIDLLVNSAGVVFGGGL